MFLQFRAKSSVLFTFQRNKQVHCSPSKFATMQFVTDHDLRITAFKIGFVILPANISFVGFSEICHGGIFGTFSEY